MPNIKHCSLGTRLQQLMAELMSQHGGQQETPPRAGTHTPPTEHGPNVPRPPHSPSPALLLPPTGAVVRMAAPEGVPGPRSPVPDAGAWANPGAILPVTLTEGTALGWEGRVVACRCQLAPHHRTRCGHPVPH